MVRMSNEEVIAEAKKDFKKYFNGNEWNQQMRDDYQELLYKYYDKGFRPQLVIAINELKKELKKTLTREEMIERTSQYMNSATRFGTYKKDKV